MINTSKINKKFEQNGYIVLPKFVSSKNFKILCNNLNEDIDKSLKKTNIAKLGGSMVGNLNVYPGIYGKKIFNILKKKKFLKILEKITKTKINNLSISVGGNLSLPKKHNQHFHTDGNFNQKMLIASIATSNINFYNGPTEVILENHDKDLPYWKFLISKKKKKKIFLNKGDLLIRKHSLWHRGTINFSNKCRFLIAFIIFDKKINRISNINHSKKIKIFENFFGNTIQERLKEFVYVYINLIYILYKILISFKK